MASNFNIVGSKTYRLPSLPSEPPARYLIPAGNLLLVPGFVLTQDNIDSFGRYQGHLYAFKASDKDGSSPMYDTTQPVLVCEQGAHLVVPDANRDWRAYCAAGVNVGTLEWCLKEYGRHGVRFSKRKRTVESLRKNQRRLWLVRFTAFDIACIPRDTDGKIRLKACVVYREITNTSSLNAVLKKITKR